MPRPFRSDAPRPSCCYIWDLAIELNPQQESRIAEALHTGAYRGSDDVIDRALQLLHEHHEWLLANRETIDAKIRTGIAEPSRREHPRRRA